MYEARQNKEKVVRAISQSRKKDPREDSMSKNVMQCLVRKDDKYNASNNAIDEKFEELNNIQNKSLNILYNNFNWNFPISHARLFFRHLEQKNQGLLHSDWGYCIEEVMNALAENIGWKCQVSFEHSHPDYGLNIIDNSNEQYTIFADSTSKNVSEKENTHVGKKLSKANIPTVNVAAADIAYEDDTLNNMIYRLKRRPLQQVIVNDFSASYNWTRTRHRPPPQVIVNDFSASYNLERKRIQKRLLGFSTDSSVAYQILTSKFGYINQKELLHIAEVCSTETKIRIDRDAKRRKMVLLKWFDENWEQISPVINRISPRIDESTPAN